MRPERRMNSRYMPTDWKELNALYDALIQANHDRHKHLLACQYGCAHCDSFELKAETARTNYRNLLSLVLDKRPPPTSTEEEDHEQTNRQ